MTETGAAAQPPLNAARGRALMTITLVNFVSLAGFGLMFPVFAIYSRQIGASGIEVAGAVAIFSFGQFLSSPVWGRLSDRYGRRKVLITGLVAGALAYLLHVFAVTPTLLLAARFVSGLATGCFAITFAVASDISTRETRTKDMGVVSAGFSLGFIFGPAIGGFAANMTGEDNAFTLVCVVGAFMGLVAACLTWLWLPETKVQTTEPKSKADSGGLALLRLPAFATLVVISVVSSAAFSQMESILGLFADDVLSLKPLGIGFLFGGMGCITTLTQLLLTSPASRHLGERVVLLLALGLIGVGTLILGASHELMLACTGLVLTSLGLGLMNPALTGLTSLSIPASAQGAGLGLMQAGGALGRVLGPLMAGPLYDLRGPSSPLYWACILLFATLIGGLCFPLTNKDAHR